MKIFIRILSLFALLMLFPACEKVLDQVPVSQISQGNYWKTPEDAEAGLTACYDGLQDALSANYVHWGEARADAVVGEGGASAVANIQALVRNTLDASNPFANWSGLYRGIARTNSVLAYVPGIQELPEPRKSQLLAEARFLRALFYFYAVRLWGDVPYIEQPYASSEVDFNVARTPAATVLDNIEADLDMAITVLPATWSATNQAQNKGKATLGAARSLLAHVYMWRAGYEGRTEYYQRTVDLTTEILVGPYSLVPGAGYGTIFTAKNSTESIFELQFDAAGQETNDVGRLYLVTSTYGGSNAYQPSPKLVAAVEPGDLRQATSFVFVQGQYMVNKFFGSPGGGTIRLNDDNLIIYRLADIILLRAEALNKTGRKPEAVEALNRIRQRAGLQAALIDDSSTEEAIETAILQERFVELCFEGHRWFDLVRTGRALQEIPSINDRRNLLWPINISEIIRNPLLEQNEYYR